MLPHSSPSRRCVSGYTLVELVVVVAIIATLASLLIPAFGYFKRRAQDAVCMTNLRNLHTALSTRLHDHAFIWPQSPYMKEGDLPQSTSPDAEAKWWYETLKPYGPSRETWLCPCDRHGFVNNNDPDHYLTSYMPTHFDDGPNVAYEWANQPWVIELGGFHEGGKGNLIFPDGHMEKRDSPGGDSTR